MLILLYGCITWMLTKRLEKKLDDNYTRMLRAILTSPGGNTPQSTNYTATCLPSRKLSKLDKPDMQDTAGEAETSSSVIYSYGPPHMAEQKQDDQLEHTYSSSVRIRDVALKTCQNDKEKWWERVRNIRANDTTWWWWWWYIYIHTYIYIYIYAASVLIFFNKPQALAIIHLKIVFKYFWVV